MSMYGTIPYVKQPSLSASRYLVSSALRAPPGQSAFVTQEHDTPNTSGCLWPPKRPRQHRHMEGVAPDDCDTLPCYESLEDLPPVAAPAPIHPTRNLDILDSPTRHWAAILLVKTKDVPRLMRAGFFWSTKNVVPGTAI